MKLFKPILKHWSYLADFVVIVAGIIVALSLDAWWQDKQDRETERHYLEQLYVDFNQNYQILSEHSKIHSDRAKNLGKVLEIMFNYETFNNDSIKEWISEGFWTTGYKLIDGTYKSLIQSGHLNKITNDSLRYALASFGGQTDIEMNKLQMQFQRTIDIQLSEYYMSIGGVYLINYEREIVNNPFIFDFKQLIKDNYFQSVLAQIRISRRESARYLIRINTHVTEILHLLEAELGIEPTDSISAE